jgi:general stress protein 26
MFVILYIQSNQDEHYEHDIERKKHVVVTCGHPTSFWFVHLKSI